MAGPSYRGFRRSAAFLACLAAVLLAGSPAPGQPARPPLRVLQLNLCDSGFAGCYSGRAVPVAGDAIRRYRPDLVTLNEICQDDVDALGLVLAAVFPGDTVVRAFRPAGDRRTGGPFLCRNGRPYGIGVLARLTAPRRAHTVDGGLFPDQDTADPEERAWLCVHAPGAFDACTTHLANTSPPIALAQCGYLFGTALPAMHARAGYEPTVVAGDLNLGFGAHDGRPDVRSCVPAGFQRRDDGGVQHVIATGDYAVTASAPVDLGQATDHPGVLVALVAVRAGRGGP